MMRSFALLLLSLLTITATAQVEAALEPSKLSFGVFAAPTLNYRTLTSQASNSIILDSRNELEIAGLGYQTGLHVDYRLNTKLELQAGVVYSMRMFRNQTETLVWPAGSESNVTEAFISQQYEFLKIPLSLRYNFTTGNKLNYYAAAGLSLSFMLSHQQRNHINTGGSWSFTSNEQLLANPNMIFAQLEGGVDYAFNSSFKLRAGLSFQHSLSATNPTLSTKEYLYNGGLRLGLVFTPKFGSN